MKVMSLIQCFFAGKGYCIMPDFLSSRLHSCLYRADVSGGSAGSGDSSLPLPLLLHLPVEASYIEAVLRPGPGKQYHALYCVCVIASCLGVSCFMAVCVSLLVLHFNENQTIASISFHFTLNIKCNYY